MGIREETGGKPGLLFLEGGKKSMKVVDMHCDTISELFQARERGETGSILDNHFHIDLNKMEQGDYFLQNFAMFVHLGREQDPFHYAMKLVDLFYTELEQYADQIRIVKSWKDIEENRHQGRMSAMLTLEEGGICKGDLACLRDFYRLGARMMTITWNFPNELGFPNGKDESVSPARAVPDTEHGLTETGIAFLEEMERLGMIIDISHLNDAGIWDVFRYTKKPFVASHSNARALAHHPRNLTDEMIRALAERGGVAGINYYAPFLKDREDQFTGSGETVSQYTQKKPLPGLCSDMVAHMKHMKQIGGIGCIGLGSDFDGINTMTEMKDASGMQLLADEMSREGFTIGEIEAVFHDNVLRVYKELL